MAMQELIQTHISKSGQLGFSVHQNPTYLSGFYRDLSNVTSNEYLEFVGKIGDTMLELNTGRFLLDLSEMKGFSISLRTAAVNSVYKLLIAKAPYFILAVLKGNNLFENLAAQTALKLTLPLSSKFLAGKMFENRETESGSAVKWLIEFPAPS